MKNIEQGIKKYFWDADIKADEIQKHPDYVIIRLLEFGDPQSIKWLFRHFSENTIRRAIKKRRGLSSKSIIFWKYFFNIKDSEILCLKKSYQKMQKTHWHQ